jgi:biopolymer transport protein ExbD
VDNHDVTMDKLAAAIAARLAEPGNKDLLVVVRADSGAPYATVHQLLDAARIAGAKRLAIATRQKMDGAL